VAKRYTISVLVEAKDKVSGVFDKITTGALERLGHKTTDLIQQLPRMAVEMVQLGAQAEAAENRFVKFAGGTERAAELLDAFQAAADGTVPRLDAMSSAARLLQMGLVGNAEEMELVTAIAVKLGNQTMNAGDRISDFAMLLANQSIPRLDNFGISSGKVRKRIKELQDSIEGLSREEAFKIAVIEEGTVALDTLGDTSELAQTNIDKLKAAFDDAKVGFAEMATDMVTQAADAAGGVDNLARAIRDLPKALEGTKTFKAVSLNVEWRAAQISLKALQNQLLEYGIITEESAKATNKQLQSVTGIIATQREQKEQIEAIADVTQEYNQLLSAQQREWARLGEYIEGYRGSSQWAVERTNEMAVATEQFTVTSQELVATWFGFQGVLTTATESFAFFHEQWQLFSEAAGVQLPRQRTGWEMVGGVIGEVRTAIGEAGPEYVEQVEEAALETEKLALEAQNAAAMTGDIFVAALADATEETDYMSLALFQAADAAGADADTLFDLADTLGLYTAAELEAAIATVALRTALDRLGEAVALGAMTMEDAISALQDLMVSMPDAVDLMERQSQVTHHITSNYRRMSEEEREAAAAARELARAMAHTGDVFIDFLPTAAEDTDAWAMALFNAADAAGASAEQLALLGGALGIYSEEQVEAALASAALQIKIEELAQAIAAEEVGMEAAIAQLQQFRDEFLPLIAPPAVTGTGAGGGAVTNNSYNMTVNTGADSSTVVQDFETLQALSNV
jgi:hypothetical protein